MSDHESSLASHPLAQRFQELRPDDILGAVEEAGFGCTGQMLALNSYENRVYQLEFDDETMVVGKFYRPGRWNRDTILAEHRFLAELAESDFAVLRIDPGPQISGVKKLP